MDVFAEIESPGWLDIWLQMKVPPGLPALFIRHRASRRTIWNDKKKGREDA
jgi:hypothetical protein